MLISVLIDACNKYAASDFICGMYFSLSFLLSAAVIILNLCSPIQSFLSILVVGPTCTELLMFFFFLLHFLAHLKISIE